MDERVVGSVSLDVSLTMPQAKANGHETERIYLRENGRTVEITRADWYERFPDREPVAVRVHEGGGQVFEYNITHNLGKMASEAGLYEAMWRPEEQGWTHARDLVDPLRDGLATLQSDPVRFEAFNPDNGWGDYDGLRLFAAAYLAACLKWPDAEVSASR